jgi:hypothetical protein
MRAKVRFLAGKWGIAVQSSCGGAGNLGSLVKRLSAAEPLAWGRSRIRNVSTNLKLNLPSANRWLYRIAAAHGSYLIMPSLVNAWAAGTVPANYGFLRF